MAAIPVAGLLAGLVVKRLVEGAGCLLSIVSNGSSAERISDAAFSWKLTPQPASSSFW